jgi:hypothetical protein
LIQSPSGIKHCGDTRILFILHKNSLHFYEVYNDFVSVFKGLLFGKNTRRISDHANNVLEKKGTLEQMENHSVIRIFCSKENPSFLPYHVSDKKIITEVARQYNFWLHFFHEKRKNKFIPLPWKIGDFIFRNINKIDEFVNHVRKTGPRSNKIKQM